MGFPTEYIEEVISSSTYVENILSGDVALLYYPCNEFCIRMFQNEIGENYNFPPHNDDVYKDVYAYWAGYILVFACFMMGTTDLNDIFDKVSLEEIMIDAAAYHMADERRYVRHLLDIIDDPILRENFDNNIVAIS